MALFTLPAGLMIFQHNAWAKAFSGKVVSTAEENADAVAGIFIYTASNILLSINAKDITLSRPY